MQTPPDAALTIRDATAADIPTIVRFNAQIAEQTEGKTLDRATLEHGVSELLAHRERGQYLVACQGQDVVGQTMWTYEWSDWRAGYFWWIQSVYVARAWRRKGVFRALHRAVEERARASGSACGVRLYVDRDNDRAKNAYLALDGQMTNYALMEWLF